MHGEVWSMRWDLRMKGWCWHGWWRRDLTERSNFVRLRRRHHDGTVACDKRRAARMDRCNMWWISRWSMRLKWTKMWHWWHCIRRWHRWCCKWPMISISTSWCSRTICIYVWRCKSRHCRRCSWWSYRRIARCRRRYTIVNLHRRRMRYDCRRWRPLLWKRCVWMRIIHGV